jgi:hypothetical protein
MPQALKLVIPGIVNTFIGLFKDTSLVLIIGLFDLLGYRPAVHERSQLDFTPSRRPASSLPRSSSSSSASACRATPLIWRSVCIPATNDNAGGCNPRCADNK